MMKMIKNKLVTVRTYKPVAVGDILEIDNNNWIRLARSFDNGRTTAKGYYLYLLSDEKLVVGDYFINLQTNNVHQADAGQVDWINNNRTDCSHCKKVLASTNTEDGTPVLSEDIVSDYIDFENKINNFSVLILK